MTNNCRTFTCKRNKTPTFAAVDNRMMKGVKIVTLLLLTVIFATTTGLVSDGYNELISYSGSYTNDILSGSWTSIHKKL